MSEHVIEIPVATTGDTFARVRKGLRKERNFIAFIVIAAAVAAFGYRIPTVAAWLGFGFAAYATVANDSVQTIGTFIGSNRQRPWWVLWAFIAGVFLITVTYSWVNYGGDVSYQRLASKGFAEAPTSFSYLQIAAPLVLLVLTRLRMPVSTTFLILSSFATSASSIGKVLGKSLGGYVIAFVVAIVVWSVINKVMERAIKRGPAHPAWSVAQWVTTAGLWSVWIMQDAANIAVYLPRKLGTLEFVAFCTVVVVGLAWMFRRGGEEVQAVVDEKTNIVDVRSATAVDAVYGVILYIFKISSKIPMSTTWVFLGLLAGRELAMALRRARANSEDHSLKGALKLGARDIFYAGTGLAVSLVVALLVNDAFRNELFAP